MDHDEGQYEQVSSCESSDVVDTMTLSLVSSVKFVTVNDFLLLIFSFLNLILFFKKNFECVRPGVLT